DRRRVSALFLHHDAPASDISLQHLIDLDAGVGEDSVAGPNDSALDRVHSTGDDDPRTDNQRVVGKPRDVHARGCARSQSYDHRWKDEGETLHLFSASEFLSEASIRLLSARFSVNN